MPYAREGSVIRGMWTDVDHAIFRSDDYEEKKKPPAHEQHASGTSQRAADSESEAGPLEPPKPALRRKASEGVARAVSAAKGEVRKLAIPDKRAEKEPEDGEESEKCFDDDAEEQDSRQSALRRKRQAPKKSKPDARKSAPAKRVKAKTPASKGSSGIAERVKRRKH